MIERIFGQEHNKVVIGDAKLKKGRGKVLRLLVELSIGERGLSGKVDLELDSGDFE